MSQTKYKLPDDLKMLCLSLVRGYERRTFLYSKMYDEIIHSSPPPNIGFAQKETKKKDKNGKPITKTVGEFLTRSNCNDNSTATKAERIIMLEDLSDVKAMRVVEHAKVTTCLDLPEDIRKKIVEAIWDSCILGRNFIYRYYNLPYEKTRFYELRREFLYTIAKNIGYL